MTGGVVDLCEETLDEPAQPSDRGVLFRRGGVPQRAQSAQALPGIPVSAIIMWDIKTAP